VAGRAAGNCERCQPRSWASGHWRNARHGVRFGRVAPNSTPVRQGRAGSGGDLSTKGETVTVIPASRDGLRTAEGGAVTEPTGATELAVRSVRLSVFPMDETSLRERIR